MKKQMEPIYGKMKIFCIGKVSILGQLQHTWQIRMNVIFSNIDQNYQSKNDTKFQEKNTMIKFATFTLTYGEFHGNLIHYFILNSAYIIIILLYLPLINHVSFLFKITIDNPDLNLVSFGGSAKLHVEHEFL